MYFDYRSRASKSNAALRSRANAAELLGISESSLSNYETGKTKVVPPEMVAQMAVLYKAPELRNIYCKADCPLGSLKNIATEEVSIEKVVIRLINCANPERVKDCLRKFVNIAARGLMDEEARLGLREVAELLGPINYALSEFFILAERQGVEWN